MVRLKRFTGYFVHTLFYDAAAARAVVVSYMEEEDVHLCRELQYFVKRSRACLVALGTVPIRYVY